MALIADGLLIAAALVAAIYCHVLSRRLRRLRDLDNGLGAAVAALSQQSEEMRRTLESAKQASGESVRELAQRTARAEVAAGRLELLLATLHEREESPRKATPRPRRSELREVELGKAKPRHVEPLQTGPREVEPTRAAPREVEPDIEPRAVEAEDEPAPRRDRAPEPPHESGRAPLADPEQVIDVLRREIEKALGAAAGGRR